jgi:chromosome segregation ATPase
MVHKVGEEIKKFDSAFPSNHKAGLHTLDSVNGASNWLDEMDAEFETRAREIDAINVELDKRYKEQEEEQEEWEDRQELEKQKIDLEAQKDEIERQRDEIHELRTTLLQKQIEIKPTAIAPTVVTPSMPDGEVVMELPRGKSITEEIKERAPKIIENLKKTGRLIESIPKGLFPEPKKTQNQEWEKFKEGSKIRWI